MPIVMPTYRRCEEPDLRLVIRTIQSETLNDFRHPLSVYDLSVALQMDSILHKGTQCCRTQKMIAVGVHHYVRLGSAKGMLAIGHIFIEYEVSKRPSMLSARRQIATTFLEFGPAFLDRFPTKVATDLGHSTSSWNTECGLLRYCIAFIIRDPTYSEQSVVQERHLCLLPWVVEIRIAISISSKWLGDRQRLHLRGRSWQGWRR